jgi:hypothetical protein
MALYLIERNYLEQLDPQASDVRQLEEFNENMGVNWLFSFLSADKKKTYCLYEAKNPEILMAHAKELGIPADEIVEVNKLDPNLIS